MDGTGAGVGVPGIAVLLLVVYRNCIPLYIPSPIPVPVEYPLQ